LGQMVSKGKVMAEELRGQLGERLPGAFQLAAKAMGVTTMELDKMLETGDVLADDLLPKLAVEIEKAFGAGAQQAAQGLQKNINRLRTEWEKFKASILDSELVAKMLRALSSTMKEYNDFTQKVDRDRATDAEMRVARVVPLGLKKIQQAGHWGEDTSYFTSYYTEDQRAAWRASRKELAEYQNAMTEGTQKTNAELFQYSETISNYLKYTWASHRKEAEDNYKAVQEAIDKKIALYKKEGTDYSYLLEQKKQADAEYRRQLDELEKKHTKKSDYRGPETIDRDYAGEAIAELRKKAEGQEKKDFRQETRDLDMVADVMQELAEKTGQYHLAVGSVNELIDRQGELWRNAGVPQNYVDQLKEVRRLEASREGWAGAMLATREYYSEATNMAEAYKGVVQNAFGGMEDAIVTACQTGKLSFTDIVNSMIADLMRLMVRQSITGPLAGALAQGIGSMFGGGAATASTNASSWAGNFNVGSSLALTRHTGGMADGSGPTRLVPSALFANAPRFHSGTGFVKPGEYPAILKTGERVLNPAETRAYQSRREPTVNVNIVNSTGQQAATRTRSDNHGNKTIDVYVGDMAAKQVATPGTTLNRAVSAQTGTKRPAIRR
ncbi:MAG: tape measure protein, partial [Mailhella sp.]|nr:tape measure protein [Mailhella sp.]